MPAGKVYTKIGQLLEQHVDEQVDESTRERLKLLVTGILESKSASPARIARAIKTLGLSEAQVDSIERRVRRLENDPEIDAALCFHPLARQRLIMGRPQELILIMDPTTQDDRVVMLTAAVWYRGRSLPIAWATWPANRPLVGARFWERVAALLERVAELLPKHTPVIWLADRAFGTPAFTDLLVKYGWFYVVRVQGHTRCKDRRGVERQIAATVRLPRQRCKLRGWVFKKRGWREASVVVYWGRRQKAPMCLVSNLGAKWHLIRLYRQRYPIEALFRDYKSHGWHWEHGQVTDLDHLERLLVGMALATWIAIFVGTHVAAEILARPPTGRRRTVPWQGKRSLFNLGLARLDAWLHGNCCDPLGPWRLSDWEAPNWQSQIYFHHARAFVFAARL